MSSTPVVDDKDWEFALAILIAVGRYPLARWIELAADIGPDAVVANQLVHQAGRVSPYEANDRHHFVADAPTENARVVAVAVDEGHEMTFGIKPKGWMVKLGASVACPNGGLVEHQDAHFIDRKSTR